jgi:[acyl-carrier-protein] S-malonyltransferase
MGKDLFEASETVRALFDEATAVAGFDVAALVFDGTEEDLTATDKQQIAITVTSLAARQYLADCGITSAGAAGFSLGEYAALVDAGVVTVADVLVAVRERGNIMERVSRSNDSETGPAGMTAVVGMGLPQVRSILADATVANAFPALYNNPAQTVVSGTAEGLDAAEAALKEAGARRVIRLKTSGPFHCPLMQAARDAFGEVLQAIPFSNPNKRLYSNVTGEVVTSGEDARELCLDQLVKTVNWTSEMESVLEDSYDALLEVGPGSVLAGHWKAFGKDTDVGDLVVVAAGTREAIDSIEAK